MARSVSGTMSTEIAKTITKPIYLINIDDTYFYSSGAQVVYETDTYIIHDIKVSGLDPDKNRATIDIGSTDLSIVTTALTSGFAGVPITVHKHYGGETKTLVAGVGSGFTINERWTQLKVVDGSVSYQRAPRIYYNDYLIDHLPQVGQLIHWDGETYLIESTNG